MAGLNVVKNVLDCLKLKYVLTERVFWSNVKSYTGTRRHTCKQGVKGVSSVAERNYWKWKLCLTLSIGDKTNRGSQGTADGTSLLRVRGGVVSVIAPESKGSFLPLLSIRVFRGAPYLGTQDLCSLSSGSPTHPFSLSLFS